MKKMNQIIKPMKTNMMNLPSPSNLSSMWSFGSMISICLVIQILTGLFLSMHYCPNTTMAFSSINHIMKNVNSGWLMRNIHTNTASLFFLFMYMHTARGLYFNSMKLMMTWTIGVLILMVSMATAFMGYILPWGQMSFWAAAVITNLLSAIPYLGETMVHWIWGGFSVNNATLNRFFSLHFILPFIIMVMMFMHFMMLHNTGSNNPMGQNNMDKIPFHPKYTIKDLIGILIMAILISMISTMNPYMTNDPENFIIANPLVTPIHIQPEWYFLFAYAILRSIPNKLGGVMALLMSILILLITPLTNKNKIQSNKFYPMNKMMTWMFFMNLIMLSWIGAKPVEMPFENISIILTINHFLFFMINPILMKMWKMN